jgi:hypothetical protein
MEGSSNSESDVKQKDQEEQGRTESASGALLGETRTLGRKTRSVGNGEIEEYGQEWL